MFRDSKVWPFLMVIGAVLTALAGLTTPTEYGIPLSIAPYIKLAELIVGVVLTAGGGVGYQHAGLPAKADADYVRVR